MSRLKLLLVAIAALLISAGPDAHAVDTTITSQIANAPGWATSTVYTAAGNLTSSRVVAGPGWTAGSPGSFTNGSNLYLWIATVSGTSASSGNGPQSCPSPGTTTVTDGGVTWRCLTQVDYVSITGYFFDNEPWAASTAYLPSQTVVSGSPLRAYILATIGSSTTTGCTSGSTPPSGTGSPSDGGCSWIYAADITYTSEASHIPTAIYNGNINFQTEDYYVGNVWYGGLGRTEYVPGSNGETDPIIFFNHGSNRGYLGGPESTPLCKNGSGWGGCGGTVGTSFYPVTLQAQTTDSFRATAANALAYNAANGVAIHATNAASQTWISGSQHGGSAIASTTDWALGLYGLQIKADHGVAYDLYPAGTPAPVQYSILDSAGWSSGGNNDYSAYYADVPAMLANSLVIYRGAQAGASGVAFKYGGTNLLGSTIVDVGGGTDSTCVLINDTIYAGPPNLAGTYCAGFTHQFVYGTDTTNGLGSTLAAGINASVTTVTTNSGCCGGGNGTDYVWVDQEAMATSGTISGSTSFSVTRGALGTTAASHLSGAVIAPYPNTSTPSGPDQYNAADTASPTPNAFTPWLGTQAYEVPFPGVGNTCGAANTSTCFGMTGSGQFVSPTTDFRLLSTAGIKGGAASITMGFGGALVGIPNAPDILDQARPNGSTWSIGAEEYYGIGPLPLLGGGRLRL